MVLDYKSNIGTVVFDKHENEHCAWTCNFMVPNLYILFVKRIVLVLCSLLLVFSYGFSYGGIHICGPRVNKLSSTIWWLHVLQPAVLSFVRQPLSAWHARLGHPSPNTLYSFTSRNNLSVMKPYKISCDSCKCIKSRWLCFYDSNSCIFSATWINHSNI